MRTFKFKEDDLTFHYDAGLRGRLFISSPKIEYKDGDMIVLPVEAVVEFVAELIRSEKIGKLEQASALEILIGGD